MGRAARVLGKKTFEGRNVVYECLKGSGWWRDCRRRHLLAFAPSPSIVSAVIMST